MSSKSKPIVHCESSKMGVISNFELKMKYFNISMTF